MSEVINELNEILRSGKNVLVYNLDEMDYLEILIKGIKESHRNILIWSGNVAVGLEKEIDRILSVDEMFELLLLYRMYEFTDKIIIVSDVSYCPGMLNYVRQGLLSKEEMAEALLFKVK